MQPFCVYVFLEPFFRPLAELVLCRLPHELFVDAAYYFIFRHISHFRFRKSLPQMFRPTTVIVSKFDISLSQFLSLNRVLV